MIFLNNLFSTQWYIASNLHICPIWCAWYSCLYSCLSSSFQRETQTDPILSTHTTKDLCLISCQFWKQRKEQNMMDGFSKLTLGSPCSQCQTHCALHCFGLQSLCSPAHHGSHITWRIASSPNNDLAWCVSVAQSKRTTTSWCWHWAIMCSLRVPPFAWKIKGTSGHCALTLLMTWQKLSKPHVLIYFPIEVLDLFIWKKYIRDPNIR